MRVAAPALQTRARYTLACTARTSAPACTSTVQHSPAAGRAMVARCSGQLPQQGGSGAAGGGLSACRVCTTSRCISPLMSIASRLSHSQGSAGKVMSNCAHRPRPASFVRAHTARAATAPHRTGLPQHAAACHARAQGDARRRPRAPAHVYLQELAAGGVHRELVCLCDRQEQTWPAAHAVTQASL